MITNFTIASVASTVYQAQAAQAARVNSRAPQGAVSAETGRGLEIQRQRLEAERLQRLQGSTPRSLTEITGQSLAMSSVAFIQTFGGDTQRFTETDGEDAFTGKRGYTAYQQFSELLDAMEQIATEAGEDTLASAADFASFLPRQLARNAEIPSENTPFITPEFMDFTAASSADLEADAPPYFQLSYTAFSQAMEFRNKAFAFPPTLNLIG